MTTGELYHLLLNHSLIGANLPPQGNTTDAFAAGFERGLNASGILPQLFEVRAPHVLGTLPHERVSELLSSLSISAKVVSVRDYVTRQQVITLVTETSLAVRYQ